MILGLTGNFCSEVLDYDLNIDRDIVSNYRFELKKLGSIFIQEC